jgi:hypothetical protein
MQLVSSVHGPRYNTSYPGGCNIYNSRPNKTSDILFIDVLILTTFVSCVLKQYKPPENKTQPC